MTITKVEFNTEYNFAYAYYSDESRLIISTEDGKRLIEEYSL